MQREREIYGDDERGGAAPVKTTATKWWTALTGRNGGGQDGDLKSIFMSNSRFILAFLLVFIIISCDMCVEARLTGIPCFKDQDCYDAGCKRCRCWISGYCVN